MLNIEMAKALTSCPCKLLRNVHIYSRDNQCRRAYAFFRKKSDGEQQQQQEQEELPRAPAISERYQSLKKRTSVQTVKGYRPPYDVEERIKRAVSNLYGSSPDWKDMKLDNRRTKFNLLTKLITEFGHDVTNMDLNSMDTVSDVVDYFTTEVRDTCAYEDMSKLDLPKNLHINRDYIRFNPETADIFEGKTAFPDRKTVVKSLKYKRKYKGTST